MIGKIFKLVSFLMVLGGVGMMVYNDAPRKAADSSTSQRTVPSAIRGINSINNTSAGSGGGVSIDTDTIAKDLSDNWVNVLCIVGIIAFFVWIIYAMIDGVNGTGSFVSMILGTNPKKKQTTNDEE